VSYDVHHTSAFSVRNYGLAAQVDQFIGKRLEQHVRRIQEAPFYVLAGADMPAILIETAFISNKDEENKLRDPYWREKIAKAIADGVLAYRDIVEGPIEDRQAWR
jgi:N-acetylmuramoyl-L-alanine amidase